ncbi:LuxR C-terminal-related transcriptional regulator [Sinomonas sp. P47F7]|uniref:LuxR C-terminal-related transcriptional regulator n=1 Tax=Sinomonas sp. P47F7 TaxID=3410987 RepID=UPI003BF5F7DB
MFDHEVGGALRYLARGLGVRIVGAPGSGRTTVAKRLVEELEQRGSSVYSVFAVPSLQAVPFAGILTLGLDLRSRAVGILGVSDLLSEHLSRPGSRVIVLDDVDNLDRESLSVVDIVHKRTNVPIVVTTGDVPFRTSTPATAALGRWPQATIAIPPLRYEQVNGLVAEMLGAPADVDVAARILASSGGNLRLAVRIIETAVLGERLVLRDGRWCLNGSTLMSVHLHSTVEALLDGLSDEEFRALNTMALLGPGPLERLIATIGPDLLDRLEHRGLVSVVPGQEGALLVSVFPPVVEDYLKGHIGTTRKIFRSAITDAFAASAFDLAPPAAADSSAAIAMLRAEMNGNHSATAQYFHSRVEDLGRLYFDAWDADRSMCNAVAFLRVYWGAPIDRKRIEEVFAHTDPTNSEPGDRLFFTITHALWVALTAENLEDATLLMAEFAEAEPGWAVEAEAWALLLEASYHRVPADLDDAFARWTNRNPASGVVPAVRGLLELFRFRPEEALLIADTATGFESLPRFDSLIRGFALFASGRVDEAIVFSLERRRDAQLGVDQFSLVTQSYVAAVALFSRGLFDEAEYVMGTTFALGRPGFLVESLYNAMVRLSSLRHPSSPGAHAGTSARDVGALPGTGKGVYDLVRKQPASAEKFDDAASRLIDEQLLHGYVLEATYTGLFTLCLLPGPRVKARLQGILDERGVARHRQLLAIADAVIGVDLPHLAQLLDGYVPDEDTYQITMLLRGATQRYRLGGEATEAIASLERVTKAFAARFPTEGQFMSIEPSGAAPLLTAREAEVALLAEERSNQDIAALLKLSIRTVESHISNGLRKTGTATRQQLAEVARRASGVRAQSSSRRIET